MTDHKSLQFIDEDGEHNLLITGEGSGKAVWVEEDGPKVNIEIKKEFIIL
jgi:hypothetical protein